MSFLSNALKAITNSTPITQPLTNMAPPVVSNVVNQVGSFAQSASSVMTSENLSRVNEFTQKYDPRGKCMNKSENNARYSYKSIDHQVQDIKLNVSHSLLNKAASYLPLLLIVFFMFNGFPLLALTTSAIIPPVVYLSSFMVTAIVLTVFAKNTLTRLENQAQSELLSHVKKNKVTCDGDYPIVVPHPLF
jgi:hypothetical protein